MIRKNRKLGTVKIFLKRWGWTRQEAGGVALALFSLLYLAYR